MSSLCQNSEVCVCRKFFAFDMPQDLSRLCSDRSVNIRNRHVPPKDTTKHEEMSNKWVQDEHFSKRMCSGCNQNGLVQWSLFHRLECRAGHDLRNIAGCPKELRGHKQDMHWMLNGYLGYTDRSKICNLFVPYPLGLSICVTEGECRGWDGVWALGLNGGDFINKISPVELL